ncbi:MAG: hypothetical protein OHK0015_11140 [Chloroflexi bacterium OHK40]
MSRKVIIALITLFALAPIMAQPAYAQIPMNSTAQLKQACETSTGNRVTITASTDIKEGVLRGVPLAQFETVNSGCTIVLGPSAKFKFDGVAMNFLGPLRIESATGNELEFDKSDVYARSVTLQLTGDGSALFIQESGVNALAGDTVVTFGTNAKLEVNGNSASYGRLLEASNVVRLTAGTKFTASLRQGYFWGVNGVDINLTGDETIYKFTEFNTHAQPGTVSFRASGAKSIFEFGRGSIYGHSGVSLTMTGAENQLITSDFTAFNTYTGTGVRIAVGANQAKGTIKMSQARFGGAGGLVIEAGIGGSDSLVEFVQGSVIGMNGTGVRITSGPGGQTIVKDSSLTPETAPVTISSQGFCLAENNVIRASTQLLCP